MDSEILDFEINGIRVENSEDDSFEIPLQEAITGVLSCPVHSTTTQQPSPTPPRTPSAGLDMTNTYGGVVTPIGIFFNSIMMMIMLV